MYGKMTRNEAEMNVDGEQKKNDDKEEVENTNLLEFFSEKIAEHA